MKISREILWLLIPVAFALGLAVGVLVDNDSEVSESAYFIEFSSETEASQVLSKDLGEQMFTEPENLGALRELQSCHSGWSFATTDTDRIPREIMDLVPPEHASLADMELYARGCFLAIPELYERHWFDVRDNNNDTWTLVAEGVFQGDIFIVRRLDGYRKESSSEGLMSN